MPRTRKISRAKRHITLSLEADSQILREAKARGGLDFGATVEAIMAERDNILQVSIEQRNMIERFLLPEIKEGRVLNSLLSGTMDERLAHVCPFHCGFKGKDADDIWQHVYQKHAFQITGTTVPRGSIGVSSAYVKKTINILEGKSIRFQEDEGPFQCPFCSADPFATKDELEQHIKTTHNASSVSEGYIIIEGSFFCPECGEGPFDTNTKLKAHIKTSHPEVFKALFKSGKRVG